MTMATPGGYASNIAIKLDLDRSLTISAKAATAFIKSTIVPKNQLVCPPWILAPMMMGFQFVVDGRLRILDDTTYTNLWVGTQSGLIMHFPQRGLGSIWHCGFVLKVNTAFSVGSMAVPWGGNVTTITFNKTLPIPFDDDSQDITISPNPGSQFNRGRIVSGAIGVMSNAVPITGNSLAFTGTGAYGRILDTRDLYNNSNGNVWDPTDLATMSVTTKDGDNNTSVTDGVMMLVGADITDSVVGANADRSVQRYPSQFLASVQDITNVGSTTFGAAAIGTSLPLASIWYSPWDISAAQTSVTATVAQQVQSIIKGGAIDEGGLNEFNLSFNYSASSVNNAGTALQICVSATHVFCKAQSPQTVGASNMTFQSIIEESEFTQTVGLLGTRYCSFAFRPSERFYTTDVFAKGKGRYIGTMFEIVTTKLTSIAEGNMSFNITGFELLVQSPTVLRPGWVGPVHVYRWDDVASGQEFRLSGVLNAQVVPNGTIQQYTRQALQDTAQVTDTNVLPLLEWIYNSESTPLCTMQTLTQYKAFVDTYMRSFDTPMLIKMLEQEQRAPQLLSALSLQAGCLDDYTDGAKYKGAGQYGALNQAQSMRAGLLSDAASQAAAAGMNGGFLDNLISVGKAVAAPALGALLGSGSYTGAGQFGAAGQFGSMNGAGQYAMDSAFSATGRRLRDA